MNEWVYNRADGLDENIIDSKGCLNWWVNWECLSTRAAISSDQWDRLLFSQCSQYLPLLSAVYSISRNSAYLFPGDKGEVGTFPKEWRGMQIVEGRSRRDSWRGGPSTTEWWLGRDCSRESK